MQKINSVVKLLGIKDNTGTPFSQPKYLNQVIAAALTLSCYTEIKYILTA